MIPLAKAPGSFTLSAGSPDPARDPESVLDELATSLRKLCRRAREALLAEIARTPREMAPAAVRRWADGWTPKLADAFAMAGVAGTLEGMRSLADLLDADESSDAAGGWEDLETAGEPPLIREAVRSLASRGLIGAAAFGGVKTAALASGHVAAAGQADVVARRVREALARSLESGGTLEQFRTAVNGSLGGTALGPKDAETVFRTNVMAAYGDGQERLLAEPGVGSLFPYRAWHATHDDRVRPEHLAMETAGIQGTNLYRADDPVWQLYRPPAGFNCRCAWNPVSLAEAAKRGIEEAQRWLATGSEPQVKAWVTMPGWKPDEEITAARGAELSGAEDERGHEREGGEASLGADYPADELDDWSEPTGFELAAPDASRYQQREITRGPRRGQTWWYDTAGGKFMPASWKPAAGRRPGAKAGRKAPAPGPPEGPKPGAKGKRPGAAAGGPKAGRPARASVDDVHGAIQAAMRSGDPVGPEDVDALAGAVAGMTDAQVKELRGRMGLTKTGGKGAKKADRVKGVVDEVMKGVEVKPRGEPPSPGDDRGGIDIGDDAPEAPPETDHDALARDVLAANAGDRRTGLTPMIPDLYDAVKAKHPGLTEPQFHDALRRMHAEGKVTMQAWSLAADHLASTSGHDVGRFPDHPRSGKAAWVATRAAPKAEPAPAPAAPKTTLAPDSPEARAAVLDALGDAPAAGISELRDKLKGRLEGADFDRAVLAAADAGDLHAAQDASPDAYGPGRDAEVIRDGPNVLTTVMRARETPAAHAGEKGATPETPHAKAAAGMKALHADVAGKLRALAGERDARAGLDSLRADATRRLDGMGLDKMNAKDLADLAREVGARHSGMRTKGKLIDAVRRVVLGPIEQQVGGEG